MKLIFAGTSHGIPEKDRFCTSTFIEVGGKVYIIDAGAPISPLLLRYGFAHADVRGIFITHLHADHFEGLPEFCTQITWYFKDSAPDIYIPEQLGVDLLRGWVRGLQRSEEDILKLHTYENGSVYRDDMIEVTAVSTRHIPFAHAFRIKAEGKNILFTGDMSWNFPEFPALLDGQHYDLVVCESAHNSGLVDCGDLLRQADTDRMIMNHVYPIKLAGIETVKFPFDFTVAHDGYTLEL